MCTGISILYIVPYGTCVFRYLFSPLHYEPNCILLCIGQPFGHYAKSKPSFLVFYWKVGGAVS